MPAALAAVSRPAANSTGATISGNLGPARSHQRPPSTVPSTPVAMKATNGQAYSDSAPRLATSAGIAVPTPIASNATMLISNTTPTVIDRRPGPNSSPRVELGSFGVTGVTPGAASCVLMSSTLHPQPLSRSTHPTTAPTPAAAQPAAPTSRESGIPSG